MEQFVFLLDKKYRYSIQKESRPDELHIEIFIDEFLKGFLFGRRQAVDGTNWQLGIFKIDLEIVKAIESENIGL